MKVSIVGAGYVGITTGVALAYLGHTVTLLDSDEPKIGLLRQGKFPIYEPFLEEFAALAQSRLRYTAVAAEAHAEADVIIIAVGTPPLPDGNPDLSYLACGGHGRGRTAGRLFHRCGQQVHRPDRLRQLGRIAGS